MCSVAGVYYHRIISHLVNYFSLSHIGHFQAFIFTKYICFRLDYLAEDSLQLLQTSSHKQTKEVCKNSWHNNSFAKLETDRRVHIDLDSEGKHLVRVGCLPAAEEASRSFSLKTYLARLGTTKPHLAPPNKHRVKDLNTTEFYLASP